jgi:predicted O-methyltransferase YrrM
MRVIEMNPVLKRILETGHFEGTDGKLIAVFAQISHEKGEFLQKIITNINPVVSLEVGLAYGVSALFICDALDRTPNTRHIVIDLAQLGDPWEGNGLYNLKKAGYDDIIEFHNMESQRALPQLEANGLKIDFAFVDGGHTFDHALVDFFYIDRMLRIGGIVAFDDVDFPSVKKVCRFIIKNRNYSVFGNLRPGQRYKPSLGHRVLVSAARFSKKVQRWLKPEILETDAELNIISDCVAFKKEAEDTRGYTKSKLGHYDF